MSTSRSPTRSKPFTVNHKYYPPTRSARDGPAAPRTPPDAVQRLLHQANRAGLRIRVDLETCAFFQTSIAFRPTLQAQHDGANAKGQTHRAELFDRLLDRADHTEAS